jgi:LytR cell envelope-related transcriptional attenuator
VDAPLPGADALIRPWRTATLVASLVAAIELVLLLGAGVLILAKPLARVVRHHAEATAFAPAKKPAAIPAHRRVVAVAKPKLSRHKTAVFVLNGNGRSGAAAGEARKLAGFGYRVPATGNAKRQDYANTVVMYRPGYAPEATRLAHDLHVKIVGPLDGLKPAALHGGQLAVLLGAR